MLTTDRAAAVKADVAFLGCNGVDPIRGSTSSNIAEAEIKQAMVEARSERNPPKEPAMNVSQIRYRTPAALFAALALFLIGAPAPVLAQGLTLEVDAQARTLTVDDLGLDVGCRPRSCLRMALPL